MTAERPGETRGWLRLGVTGHRRLPDDPTLAERIGEAIARARAAWDTAHGPVSGLVVVSSLAEGADCLVANLALQQPNTRLLAPLPLPPAEYRRDFAAPASWAAFTALLARAEVVVLPPAPTREDAYLAGGLYVAEQSDVLLAVWDGLPARGPAGTGAIVQAARAAGRPLVWVESDPPYPMHVERLPAAAEG